MIFGLLSQTISDSSIRQLAACCPKLQKLCVSKCAELTDLSLMALSQHNQLLNTLEVSGCRNFTDIGFQALGRNCKYLERMDLEECSQITDLTLAHLATGCPSLEKLVSIQKIRPLCKSTKCLLHALQTLSHCELITDDGIRHLTTSSCAAESLSVLELDNCPLITDRTLEHLVSCHNLQRIELFDCQLISRAAIRKLKVGVALGVLRQLLISLFIL